jgi:hypothetical protein
MFVFDIADVQRAKSNEWFIFIPEARSGESDPNKNDRTLEIRTIGYGGH